MAPKVGIDLDGGPGNVGDYGCLLGDGFDWDYPHDDGKNLACPHLGR